jgi:hypothetical protein
MLWPLALVLAFVAPMAAQGAEARLSEASARAFVSRQQAAWNARDIRAFAATFTQDAVFIDQARNSNGGVTSNGSSTLAQATAQATRFFAKSRFQEAGVVDSVVIAPDGRSANVAAHVTTRLETDGRPVRFFCAQRAQTLVLRGGRILSRGQTDTGFRCPR